MYYLAAIYRDRGGNLETLLGRYGNYAEALSIGIGVASMNHKQYDTVVVMMRGGKQHTIIEVVSAQCFVVRLVK